MVNFTPKNSNYAIVFCLQKGYHKKWVLGTDHKKRKWR